MVTNYPRVVVDAPTIIRFLISNSLKHGNYNVCYQGCKAVWEYCQRLAPYQDRGFDYVRDTRVLGNSRKQYLECLIVSSTKMNDFDLACKGLLELKCMELNN